MNQSWRSNGVIAIIIQKQDIQIKEIRGILVVILLVMGKLVMIGNIWSIVYIIFMIFIKQFYLLQSVTINTSEVPSGYIVL